MSISIRPPIHDCYKNFMFANSEKFFNCDGCKMKGFGERYTCCLCGTRLHVECRYPRSSISHENFAGFIFRFYYKPFIRRDDKNRVEFSKCCNACGKDICGFNYHCEEGNLDLHPCCRKLESKLMINHMIFDLVKRVSSRCVKCGKRKIERNIEGWAYVSQCRRYNLHVYCLNEIIQEAYMKRDNLTLRNIDSTEIVSRNRNYKYVENTFVTCVKLVIKILLSALLGDPTTLFSSAMVEVFWRHLRPN